MRLEIAFKCLDGKHHSAQTGAQTSGMKAEVVQALADNVKRLMADRGDTQASLAKRAGISQRAVGDLMTYGKGHFKNPTVKTVDNLAEAFDLPAWMLLLPGLPLELLKGQRLTKLIENYVEAPEPGRATVDRIAESEVRYAIAEETSLKKTGS